MSLHKLTAGDGYTYLTRQVAAQDASQRGYASLADYYAQRGESPGLWMGRGADRLPGFPAAPEVTEAQMLALFGQGRHPDAHQIEQRHLANGTPAPAALAATRLGAPYKVFTGVKEFRKELAIRFEAWNSGAGLPRDWPIPADERARIRTELGRQLFAAEFGRPPADARELSGLLARASRQRTTAVAGYDLTFSPVKSVSALWAVAPPDVADRIEQAHAAAVADTLRWLEQNATYTRLGRNGVQQVEVRGLIAAAFTHRDSRAGDPDLHTHVAVSNKVQTLQGRWLALDGRPLHKLTVAASERYNTRLEAQLTAALGVEFADRPGEAGKRPVREIVGVSGALNRGWSARRASIDVRRAALSATFQADHGRPPGPIEAVKLAQQATLETRPAKHSPRSQAEQRTAWRAEAVRILGDEPALAAMITGACQRDPDRSRPVSVTPEWVVDTAESVLLTVQGQRATWQEAHVRAEAERRARTAGVGLAHLDDAVERVVAAALSPAFSMPLGVPEPLTEPASLRRRDGTSVYATAGTRLYTSRQIVLAERTLLATAQRGDGRVTSAGSVELALLEAAARGTELNPGQAQLVRDLATSGLRLQLALAPAGTGKTTAMAVLAKAWSEDGGTIVGLAPSAAAAAVLGAQIGIPTDTLAKLTWSLDHPLTPSGGSAMPGWVSQIGPSTLVIVDEAGMAGTTELAQAVEYIVGRGGSVRLIGDDQQLAAIGAGGVLRDLAEQAGAVTLSQVVRFTDPAEGAASLALRSGDDAALGFYLDAGRVHVGDPGTVVDAAYSAWSDDQAAGTDSVMLAPTRELVATLNARARTDRLAATTVPVGAQARLADGSTASAGDVVISRRNERRLAISSTDWVKNGDRWTVTAVLPGGAVDVMHLATRRPVTLPAAYVAEHLALGYASTVHGAQGVTAQVCHVVATGTETRQLLYVAMTRGQTANHVYLSTAGDGNEHSVITPDALQPPTAGDLLGRVLARDGAQASATTRQRELADPAVRLVGAADRFYDSLTTAAATQLGPRRLTALDQAAEAAFTGLTDCPAYPTLRAHLALLAADGHDPIAVLGEAVAAGELSSAADAAAVLDWRLNPSRQSAGSPPPLPWLPAVPESLAANVTWGHYLQARATLVSNLAEQVRKRAGQWTPTSAPAWATTLLDHDPELLADLAVWRAAHDVPDSDRRPTGPPQHYTANVRAQRALNQAITTSQGDPRAAAKKWAPLVRELEPRLLTDPYWPQLAERLAAADRAGITITALTQQTMSGGPLPDEHPAAALWWRLSRHLSPAVLDAHDNSPSPNALRPAWTAALLELVDSEVGLRVLADPAWPALVAAVTNAANLGWRPEQVLTTAYQLLLAGHDEPNGQTAVRPAELATALLWRVGMLSDPEPADHDLTPPPADPSEADFLPPEDLYEFDNSAPVNLQDAATAATAEDLSAMDEDWLAGLPAPPEPEPEPEGQGWPLVPADPAQVGQTLRWQPAAVPRERLLEMNQQAVEFFASRYAGSWAARHLHERLGADRATDSRFRPGYAPAGWTALTDHLHALGASDSEILAAGLGSTTRNGAVIDRFRDRLVFPICHGADVRGFIGRRNPTCPEAGPKYLNTAQTDVFDKGQLLYGLTEGAGALTAGAVPVLVEGPLDAIAVTLASGGRAVGVAPLGTAFSGHQADLLRPYLGEGKVGVIVATDADTAGQQAAIRAYWQLTARGGDPRHLVMANGTDPAELLQTAGPQALRQALEDPPTLARTMIDARVADWADRLHTAEGLVLAVRSAADVIGALPPAQWLEHITYLQTLVDALPGQVHLAVLDAGQAWTANPDGTTRRQLARHAPRVSVAAACAPDLRSNPLDTAVVSGPSLPAVPQTGGSGVIAETIPHVADPCSATRWADLGCSIDPRLVTGADWPGLAAALDRAQQAGYDVEDNLPRLAGQRPLPAQWAARTLQYRLVQDCEAAITPPPPQGTSTGISQATGRSRAENPAMTRTAEVHSRPR
jgi:DNA primase catalytic core